MLNNRIKIYVTSNSEEVTGTNNHIKVEWPNGRTISFLVDCGLFQEEEHNHINTESFPYHPDNVSFVLVTHAHTDHIGRLPYLVNSGFYGKIYTSYESAVLMPVVLYETAERLADEYRRDWKTYKIKKEEQKKCKINQKGRGKKDKPRRYKPKGKENKISRPKLIFDKSDVDQFMLNVEAMELNRPFYPCDGIEVTFYPNAHIAGAVLTVCKIFDEDEELYLLFTGDLGMKNPVTNVKTNIPRGVANKIDVILSESTYGSAEFSKNTERERKKHISIIKDVCRNNGTIMYMSNALERPLRLGADLKEMQLDKATYVNGLNIFLDTTFGIKCLKYYTRLYGKDYLPDNLTLVDKENRGQVILANGPKMIICTSPRLKQGSFLTYGASMLEDPNVTLIFVAYVPEYVKNIINLPYGTEIEFMGEKVTLRCKRYQFGYYSSHVSTKELDQFLSEFKNAKIILFNHGTHDSKSNYVDRYKKQFDVTHNLLYGKTVLITKNGIEKYY